LGNLKTIFTAEARRKQTLTTDTADERGSGKEKPTQPSLSGLGRVWNAYPAFTPQRAMRASATCRAILIRPASGTGGGGSPKLPPSGRPCLRLQAASGTFSQAHLYARINPCSSTLKWIAFVRVRLVYSLSVFGGRCRPALPRSRRKLRLLGARCWGFLSLLFLTQARATFVSRLRRSGMERPRAFRTRRLFRTEGRCQFRFPREQRSRSLTARPNVLRRIQFRRARFDYMTTTASRASE
jgi:hypothetical protein